MVSFQGAGQSMQNGWDTILYKQIKGKDSASYDASYPGGLQESAQGKKESRAHGKHGGHLEKYHSLVLALRNSGVIGLRYVIWAQALLWIV